MKNVDVLFADNPFDAVLVVSEVNGFYFSDFRADNVYALIERGALTLFLDGRYTRAAAEKFGEDKAVRIVDITLKNPYGEIKRLLDEKGVKLLGFENLSVKYSDYERVKALDRVLVGAEAAINALRRKKTADEIFRIKTAAKIADGAYKKVLCTIKAGVSEKETADELIYLMRRGGAEDVSFDPIVAFGANTAEPHHVYGGKRLAIGDAVTIDMGAKYSGYCSDMTRSFIFGRPNDKYLEIYGVVREAQKTAAGAIVAGMTAKQADQAARGVIEAAGYGKYFSHSLGHSVGVEIHEPPSLSQKSDAVLAVGDVVTVEPGLYIEGLFGVRIEDMGVVGEGGFESFSNSEKAAVLP
ncbi:MAG: aminopeptidase P family protein [Clostridiales bacterium]|jgi:Xaa-Pro aminopeptidase|nr:aminopeptidase P family protein [Clostridiales bacterium]